MRDHATELRIQAEAPKSGRPQARTPQYLRAWVLCAAQLAGYVLCQPAFAQYGAGLDFLNGRFEFEGEKLELMTPDGISCRFTEADKPSFSAGAGLARPQILPGVYGENPIGAQFGGSDPVAGVAIRVPFGGSQKGNCDRLVAIETAKSEYQTAKLMFEDGLITEEQLREIAVKTFNVLVHRGR
jgi:hypothetical protein